MAESVYMVVELIGTSDKSWEDAAKAAVERAAKNLRDLRVAEVVEQDIVIENGKVEAYRTSSRFPSSTRVGNSGSRLCWALEG